MTTLMRQTWNFSGSIVSDDGAVQQISNGRTAGNLHGHGYAHSVPGAAAAALEGGAMSTTAVDTRQARSRLWIRG